MLDDAFRPYAQRWLDILDATLGDATRTLLSRLGHAPAPQRRAAGASPYADAATVDRHGRPLCDGTTHRATRNCRRLADFRLRQPGARTAGGYACTAHAGQVARALAGGEAGAGHACVLTPITTVE